MKQRTPICRRSHATVAVIALAVVAMAVGCSPAPPDADPNRPTVTWMMGIDAVNKPMLDELVAEFRRQHPDIDLQMMWVPGGSQYHTKLKTLTAAGQPPDLFWCSDVFATYMLPSLADLTELADRDREELDLEDFYPEILEACQRDGRYYYLPRYFNVSLLYYNKDHFDAAGLAYPTADWTWDDYLDAARRLTLRDERGQVTQWGATIAAGWWGEWHILVQQAGGSFFSEDLTRCTLDTPEAIRGLRFYYDKIHEHGVSPRPGYGPSAPGLASGAVSMDFGGHTALWTTYRKIDGLRWDVQLLPKGPVTREGGEVAVDAIGIARDTKHLEAAWEVLKFIVSRPSIRRHVEQGYLPVRRSVAEETVLAKRPGDRDEDPRHREVVYDALRGARTLPLSPDFVEIALEVVQPEFDIMLLGDCTPEEAARRATRAVDRFIDALGSLR